MMQASARPLFSAPSFSQRRLSRLLLKSSCFPLFTCPLFVDEVHLARDRSPATPPSTPSPVLGVEGDQVPGGTSDGPPNDQGAGQVVQAVSLTSSFSLFLLLAFLPQNPILFSSFDLCHGSSSLFDGSCFPSGDSCFFLAWETCLLPFSSLWILLDDSFRCWLPLASPLQFWIPLFPSQALFPPWVAGTPRP